MKHYKKHIKLQGIPGNPWESGRFAKKGRRKSPRGNSFLVQRTRWVLGSRPLRAPLRAGAASLRPEGPTREVAAATFAPGERASERSQSSEAHRAVEMNFPCRICVSLFWQHFG